MGRARETEEEERAILERKCTKWSVMSVPLGKPENEDTLEPWCIDDMLFESIADTEQPPELIVHVVKQGKVGICDQLNCQSQALDEVQSGQSKRAGGGTKKRNPKSN